MIWFTCPLFCYELNDGVVSITSVGLLCITSSMNDTMHHIVSEFPVLDVTRNTHVRTIVGRVFLRHRCSKTRTCHLWLRLWALYHWVVPLGLLRQDNRQYATHVNVFADADDNHQIQGASHRYFGRNSISNCMTHALTKTVPLRWPQILSERCIEQK